MGHMLKSRLLVSSFANEKQEWQLDSKDMTIDHIAIPRTPTQKTEVSNNHKSFSALNTVHFMTRLQKLLMNHQVCHTAYLQLNTGGFPTKFHVSQESIWETTLQKLHICLLKLRYMPMDQSFSTRLWRRSKTSALHQQGLVQTISYTTDKPNTAPSAVLSLIPTHDAFRRPAGHSCWAERSTGGSNYVTLYQEKHHGALV